MWTNSTSSRESTKNGVSVILMRLFVLILILIFDFFFCLRKECEIIFCFRIKKFCQLPMNSRLQKNVWFVWRCVKAKFTVWRFKFNFSASVSHFLGELTERRVDFVAHNTFTTFFFNAIISLQRRRINCLGHVQTTTKQWCKNKNIGETYLEATSTFKSLRCFHHFSVELIANFVIC